MQKKTNSNLLLAAGLILSSLLFNILLAQSIAKPAAGDVISAGVLNRNFQMVAPEGLLAAFYRTACPEGWLLADGTQGTPDLRGVFMRGRDPGNATGRDEDGERAVGNYQADQFASHKHTLIISDLWGYGTPYIDNHLNPGNNNPAPGLSLNRDTTNAGTGVETRPKNVAVLFCMRKDL